VHGVGGILGALLTGVFAQRSLNAAGPTACSRATPCSSASSSWACSWGAYSGLLTWGLLKLVDKVMGLRVTRDEELEGLDASQHGESGYIL
jgi:Amt family ammonium transporter